MPLAAESVRVLDPAYRNGDSYWDGDQTLYEVVARERGYRQVLRLVVSRGDAFITPAQVRRFLQRSMVSLSDLQSRTHSPATGDRPEFALEIVPADVLPTG